MPEQRYFLGGPLTTALLYSLLAHGLCIGLGFWGAKGWFTKAKPEQVIITKLVKLGTARKDDLLPRLEGGGNGVAEALVKRPEPTPVATPPAVKEEAAPAVPISPAPQEATTPASLQDALKRLTDKSSALANKAAVQGALERLQSSGPLLHKKGNYTGAGDPSGVEGGEVVDVESAIVGSKFATEIFKCVRSHYAIEGLERAQVRGKQALTVIKVRPNGVLFDFKLVESSGIPLFDKAVARAVLLCKQVSPPPVAIRNMALHEGIEILFKGDDL